MSETELGVFEVKTHLSRILRAVQAGEHFVITSRGRPVAELRPMPPEKLALKRGCAANSGYRMAPDFNEPLDELAEYM